MANGAKTLGEAYPGRFVLGIGVSHAPSVAVRGGTYGPHPYFVPVKHTPFARQHLGPEPFLVVEQTAVLTTDPAEGRQMGRAFAKNYLALPNYANDLRRLGWGDEDLAGDGSDRLIDAVIAWGDIGAIVKRVRAHLDAGADQVCIQLRADPSSDPALGAYGELAAALLETRR